MWANLKRAPLALLGPMLLLPAVQTAVAVHWQWHPAVSYPGLKALMIALPILIWLSLRRSRAQVWATTGLKRTNLRAGLLVGGLMAGVILAGYYAVFRPTIDPAPLLAKVRSLGLGEHYWAMSLVVSLWNSLFEEYYWRAFLVGELRLWTTSTAAVVAVAGAMFGLHHVFAMLSVFELPLVCLFAAGTALAGAVWAWMRLRGVSIFDCYLSHILADLAIMWIGYDLILRAR